MKLKFLFSLLFIIATTLSAIHEIEHINHNHDSNSCEVCIINHNLLSSDVIAEFQEIECFIYANITLKKPISKFYTQKHTNQNRAPPFLS